MSEIFVADCQRRGKVAMPPEQYLKEILGKDVEIHSIVRDWSVRGFTIQYDERTDVLSV